MWLCETIREQPYKNIAAVRDLLEKSVEPQHVVNVEQSWSDATSMAYEAGDSLANECGLKGDQDT
jgi:hypothetical protein